jgi:hypothetical protein
VQLVPEVTSLEIPLEIIKTKDPDGKSSFKAIVSFGDAIAHSEQSQKLIQIQNQYTELVDRWQKAFTELRSNRKLMADSKRQWRLADEIHLFSIRIEKDGYFFANASEALSRDLGVSKSRLNYLAKFRKHYPSIELVSPKINYSKYQEILDIRNPRVREECEKKILSGELQKDSDIRAFKREYRTRSS